MARKLTEPKLVVASHNAGKVREIGELLAPFGLEVISAGDLNLPEPDETETTYIGNAELKARAAATASRMPALADDSGLSVEILSGDPGIYSARWAGPNKDFTIAMEKVWTSIQEKETEIRSQNRAAAFICALSICWPDGHTESVEGRVEGEIVWPPRGDLGFGYDPIFQPVGKDWTFGECDPEIKHAMSHRADAFNKLTGMCFR